MRSMKKLFVLLLIVFTLLATLIIQVTDIPFERILEYCFASCINVVAILLVFIIVRIWD
jgi:hypothetical protein